MTSPPPPERPSGDDDRASLVDRSRDWRLWAPLVAVVLALAALVTVPVLGDRYVSPLHDQMRRVAEPGRSLVTEIHVALAIEGMVLRDFEESGRAEFVDRYRDAASLEQSAYDQLRPLAARLGPTVAARFAEVDSLQRLWHARIDRRLADGRPTHTAPDPAAEDLYEELLLAAAELDREINGAAQERRAAILRAERAQRWSVAALGIIALGAAVVVGFLGRQLRAFGRESERRRIALERLTESRARMMRGISHDLKNPLTAIDGHAVILLDGLRGPVTPEQADGLARIRRSAAAILALVSDLLELSRAEAGELRVSRTSVAIADLVREAAADYGAAASAASHELRVDVADELSPVHTDPERVRQVLGNLLSNAIKYTPAGGRIDVSAREGDGARIGRTRACAIAVTDTGPGIPHADREAVFDEFTRLPQHLELPGTGLGLSIAKRVARLLDGDLLVEDGPHGGSVFTLLLPVAATPR